MKMILLSLLVTVLTACEGKVEVKHLCEVDRDCNSSTPQTPVQPTDPSDPVTPTDPVADDPSQNQGDRVALYSCSSIPDSRLGDAMATSLISVFTDGHREYETKVRFQDGFYEEFTANENADSASKYPIVKTANKSLSSDVLHGMSDQLRARLKLSSKSSFQLNLFNALDNTMRLDLNVDDERGTSPLALPDLVCFEVKR